MAVATRIRRLNPRVKSRKKTKKRKKSNAKRHSHRSKNAASRKTKVRIKYRTRKVYVTKKTKKRRKKNSKKRRSSNPGLLVTYGPALNPRKRSRKMAKKYKAKKRTHKHRKTNPVKVVYRYRTKKRNTHRRSGSKRSRNPIMFGRGHGIMGTGKAIIFGLAGVTATKAVVNSSLVAGFVSSPLMKAVASAVVAWGGGILVGKWDREAGDAFMFGGMMQAGSLALNAVIPSVGSVIGLSGLRGLTPSNDIGLPYNPFQGRGAMVAAGGAGSIGGANSGFAPPFA